MNYRKTLLISLLLSAASAGCDRQLPAMPKPAKTAAPVGSTALSYSIPILELHGTPVELGRQYAALEKREIVDLDKNFVQRYLPASPAEHFGALLLASSFKQKLRPEHRDELDALAGAAQVSAPELMLANCFLDIMPVQSCSTITLSAMAAPDHIARFGRNLDFASLDAIDQHSVVIVYHPAGRHAFACVTWPGLIGVLSGMNASGLCVANMEVDRPSNIVVRGMPYILLYRTLLENCQTVDEAVAMLQSQSRQTSNNVMLMDASGARAVVEITPEAVAIRRAEDSRSLISSNHQRGQDADSPGRCGRYDALHDLSSKEFGRIDPAALESMLVSASQGDFTLQSMIFEPSTRVIYLATGKDAARRTFERIDLKPYLDRVY